MATPAKKQKLITSFFPSSSSASSPSAPSTPSTTSSKGKHIKKKCPWTGCSEICASTDTLRRHYRRHSKLKPYICFGKGSCDQACITKQSLENHFSAAHGGKLTAANMKVLQLELDQEAAILGIKNRNRGKVYMGNEKTAQVSKFTLEPLSRVILDTDGFYLCPVCKSKNDTACRLKEHYRRHFNCRPFQCSYDEAKCQYLDYTKSQIQRHLEAVHNFIGAGSFKVNQEFLNFEKTIFENFDAKVYNLAFEDN
ncbi:hypothetical protein TYRP_018513 [Tyrophagus putrescentiae]|nr:hypothetical protein TYRP_018513 [Tyrophagus putrescentiae]